MNPGIPMYQAPHSPVVGVPPGAPTTFLDVAIGIATTPKVPVGSFLYFHRKIIVLDLLLQPCSKEGSMGSMNASKGPSTSGIRMVPIEVRADGAKEVAIAGDFNRWGERGLRLKPDGNGTWRRWLELKPRQYQYLLIVEGHGSGH